MARAQGSLLGVEEARRKVLDVLAPLPTEQVALGAAHGRVLAAPVRALDPAPPFDASEMDGYALRAAEVADASTERLAVMDVAFEIHAGDAPPGPLPPGQACWIATGAPVPEGADAIIPREWTRREGARVAIDRPSRGPGVFIRRRGEDCAEGETVLEPGTLLTPGRVALAASAGATALEVRRRPRVAVIATGDELIEPGSALRPGAIRESNRLLLSGLVSNAGGEAHDLGIVRDEREATERALERGLSEFDVTLTAGGVSVGERDLVRAALEAVGARLEFWHVSLKPGKPLAFATRGRALLFALPGNPAAAFVSFHLFVAPALRFLQGRADVEPEWLEAELEAPAEADEGRRTYLRAELRRTPAGALVRPLSRQASGSVRSVAEANALIVLERGERRTKGERVRVETLS